MCLFVSCFPLPYSVYNINNCTSFLVLFFSFSLMNTRSPLFFDVAMASPWISSHPPHYSSNFILLWGGNRSHFLPLFMFFFLHTMDVMMLFLLCMLSIVKVRKFSHFNPWTTSSELLPLYLQASVRKVIEPCLWDIIYEFLITQGRCTMLLFHSIFASSRSSRWPDSGRESICLRTRM